MTEPNPAASSTARTRPGSARENGPGSPGPGIGGSDPVTLATAAPGMSIHSLSNTLCQQTKDSTPPGRSALRTLAKAATGSAKNITPKREYAASNRASPKSCTWTSACANSMFLAPARAARSRPRASISAEMSTPTAPPAGPTREASSSVVLPDPHPRSATRCPGRKPKRSIASSPGSLATSSSWSSSSSHVGASCDQNSACSMLTKATAASLPFREHTDAANAARAPRRRDTQAPRPDTGGNIRRPAGSRPTARAHSQRLRSMVCQVCSAASRVAPMATAGRRILARHERSGMAAASGGRRTCSSVACCRPARCGLRARPCLHGCATAAGPARTARRPGSRAR